VENRFKKITMVYLLFNLTGCANLQWPPREQVKHQRPTMSKGTLPPPPISRFSDIPVGGIVRVKKGDTLFILSRRYGVSSQTIIDANDLTPPYRLRRGESLIVPRPRVHAIVRGESLYKISRRYGVDVYELARLNNLQAPFRIYVGQKLVLPSYGVSDPPVYAAVKKRRKVVSKLKENQMSTPVNKKFNNKMELNGTLSKPKKDKSILNRLESITVPYVKTSGRFNWPVRGRLSSIYGSKGQGLHNDGINIIAPLGTSVRAADAGVVAYAGNELRGFGNLLLIKHSGGWVTAYAHNEKLLVKRGDKVNKGQIVAKVGASGNVVQPQLHFEVRKGKRAINPLRHLMRIDATMIKDAGIFL